MTDKTIMGLVCLCIDDSVKKKKVNWDIIWTAATLRYGSFMSK